VHQRVPIIGSIVRAHLVTTLMLSRTQLVASLG
jgi:hypothetical protein